MPADVVITRQKTRDTARLVVMKSWKDPQIGIDRIAITRMITIAVRG